MKSVALSIAIAVLGAGCVVATDEPCTNTVIVYWVNGFTNEWGDPTSCGGLGLNYVDVFDGSTRIDRFACTDDYAVLQVQAGTYDLVIEGGWSDGYADTVIARDFLPGVAATVCGGETLEYASPGRGRLSVGYAIEGANLCQASPATYMWYALADDTSGRTIYGVGSSSTSADKISMPCGTPFAVIPVPYGSYTLDHLWEVEYPTTAPGVVSATLAPASATVSVPSTAAPLNVTLYYP